MVVMFNHKMTKAWRALGKALIEAGFEIRTSIPIHTEAESSLNIRGLDAARSTVLLLCLPREQTGQVTGNWGRVQERIAAVARNAAAHFQKQGIVGTDLYLSALGPTLGEVGRALADHRPRRPTDRPGGGPGAGLPGGRSVAVGADPGRADARRPPAWSRTSPPIPPTGNTQALWLWLDTFQGDVADSDDVRKLAKSLNIEPDTFKKLKLIEVESGHLLSEGPAGRGSGPARPSTVRRDDPRGRAAREEDVWEERKFPNFLGAAVWNAIALMAGGDELHRGVEPLKRWLRGSGYGDSARVPRGLRS